MDDDEGDISLTGNLVSPAAAIAIHINTTRHTQSADVTKLSVSSAPIELCYRHRTIANLKLFAETAGSRHTSSGTKADNSPSSKDTENGRDLQLMCSSPSLSLVVPILKDIDSDILFSRCGEIMSREPVSSGCLGLLFEDILIEKSVDSALELSCQQAIAFATAPKGGRPSISTNMQRMDIFVASGRLEVDPCIPISLHYDSNSGTDLKRGRKSAFPLVPNISSFKARQEDEDDESIDRMLRSKLGGVKADSRRDLRASADPQSSMLRDAEMCKSTVSIMIPSLKGDLTVPEIKALATMLDAATPPSSKPTSSKENGTPSTTSLCFTLSITDSSFGVHATSDEGGLDYSFLVPMEKIVLHTVVQESGMKHIRFLCHDMAFYEMSGHGLSSPPEKRHESHYERGRIFSGRLSTSSPDCNATPIFYRSHLFTPISRESPSFLIDLINVAPEKSTIDQKRIHLNLYHLTYRFNADSAWIERLQKMANELTSADQTSSSPQDLDAQSLQGDIAARSSLTRVSPPNT